MKNKKAIVLIIIIITIAILGTSKVLGSKQDDNRIGDKELQQIIENLGDEEIEMESHQKLDNDEELNRSLVAPITD